MERYIEIEQAIRIATSLCERFSEYVLSDDDKRRIASKLNNAAFDEAERYMPLDSDDVLNRIFEHYKKDVAREIFEEIEKYMMDSVDVTHTAYKTIGTSTFAILKKKYTEGQK
jgi:hypothetical protein